MKTNYITVIAAVFLLASCVSGEQKYSPSTLYANQTNTKIIAKSKDQVWDSFIPALSSKFFVINNIDKASGLINVSYSGDPEKYVDCGQQHSSVKNARGERTYDLPL